jgi:hypothetical protein
MNYTQYQDRRAAVSARGSVRQGHDWQSHSVAHTLTQDELAAQIRAAILRNIQGVKSWQK